MNLKNKIIHLAEGTLIAKIFSFFSFFFIAKVLSLEVFSVYVIYLFLSEIFLVVLTLGLNSYILRNSNLNVRNKVFPRSVFLIVATIFLFWIFVLAIPSQLVEFLPKTYVQIFEYKHLIVFILLSRSLVNMCYGFFVSNHKALSHAKLNIGNAVLFSIILLINYFALGLNGLEFIFISLCETSLLSILYSYILIKEEDFIKPVSVKEMIILIKESYPFMFKNIIGIVGLYLSRLVLDEMATREELAVYSFYLMIVFQLSLFSNILSQAIMPTIRDNFDKVYILEEKLRKYLNTYFIFAFLILLFFYFISFLISNNKLGFVQLFIREEYLSEIWLFNIMLLAFLINMMKVVVFDAWQYYEKINIKLKLIVISCSNVVLGLVSYPLAYNIGSIYGVALAYLLIVLIFTYVSYHYFNVAKRMAKFE
jgi:O-antigen/teichoic acid export membrane protein